MTIYVVMVAVVTLGVDGALIFIFLWILRRRGNWIKAPGEHGQSKANLMLQDDHLRQPVDGTYLFTTTIICLLITKVSQTKDCLMDIYSTAAVNKSAFSNTLLVLKLYVDLQELLN